MQDEHAQQRPLPAPAERDRALTSESLQWTENAELHASTGGGECQTGPTYSRAGSPASPLLPRCYRSVAALKPPRFTIRTSRIHTPRRQSWAGQSRSSTPQSCFAPTTSRCVRILATDDDVGTTAGSATQVTAPSPTGTTRYDGGPEEGSRGVIQVQRPGVRYDGGPEEGSRGALSSGAAPGTRYDGGPEEGSRGARP